MTYDERLEILKKRLEIINRLLLQYELEKTKVENSIEKIEKETNNEN